MSLLTLGIAATFFLFFAVNMSMVMGLAPVVGVPLPLVSYGGSAMLVLLAAFGLCNRPIFTGRGKQMTRIFFSRPVPNRWVITRDVLAGSLGEVGVMAD